MNFPLSPLKVLLQKKSSSYERYELRRQLSHTKMVKINRSRSVGNRTISKLVVEFVDVARIRTTGSLWRNRCDNRLISTPFISTNEQHIPQNLNVFQFVKHHCMACMLLLCCKSFFSLISMVYVNSQLES